MPSLNGEHHTTTRRSFSRRVRLVQEILGVASEPTELEDVVCSFLLYNLAFCRSSAFGVEKTAALCAILQDTLRLDVKSRFCRIESSFGQFKAKLIEHAVQRPPYR